MDPQQFEKQRAWDLVTRLWHWLFATTVIAGWLLGEFMEFSTIQWHFYLGYGVLGLIVFRLIWGLVGPRSARFSSLQLRPSATVSYLKTVTKRQPSGEAGHNPIGSISVVAILLAVAAQAATGLFIESEDFFEYGPLTAYVSESTMKLMGIWHHRFAKVVLVLVALHLSAMLFYYLWKRENLVLPMITGWKWVRKRP